MRYVRNIPLEESKFNMSRILLQYAAIFIADSWDLFELLQEGRLVPEKS